MKTVSIVCATYNEEENVREVYRRVKRVFAGLPQYEYEHIFIDNASEDNTVAVLRELAAGDRRVKVIVNARNFGHIRSPSYAIINAQGDAVVSLVADLQDPPELIVEFLKKWEEGFKIVCGVKKSSEENGLMFLVRRMYYKIINALSHVPQIENFTGFGLYDRSVIKILRDINDPYPYFRGLIAEIGFPPALIEYGQPARKFGLTKNNFYTLYDMAMLGITNYSRIPLRLAVFVGFITAGLSLFMAAVYLLYKLVFWYSFSVGMAPMIIGIFFFSSVQLIFIGIIGEYIGEIHTQVLRRPLVVVKERINF
ncbi:MAG: glycosyltransferase family 2 protein [Elusimicrobiaceae bacterium]|nr:glycosyltransferase family 2 protein [Elusimicrobiaceae bacterium]